MTAKKATAKSSKGKTATKAAPKRGRGRPSVYTEKIGDQICERIALGESLRSICEDKAMPARLTVIRWLLKGEPADFCNRYAQARQVQAETFADDLQEIADDGRNDWMEMHDRNGECIGYKINGEAVARSKLRADTRKWIAERMLPRKYGNLVKHADHTGEGSAVFQVILDDGEGKE